VVVLFFKGTGSSFFYQILVGVNMNYLTDYKKNIKLDMLKEYYLTTESAEYIANKYQMSLSTFRRAQRELKIKVVTTEIYGESWKLDSTGYFISNIGRIKDQDNNLVKVFKNLGGLNTILELPQGQRRFLVKDLMYRSFIGRINDDERVIVNGDPNNFALNDLKLIKKD
jgi:hypothetical protein